MNENILKNNELWKKTVLNMTLSLLGRISKNMRGITLNFDDETIKITVLFENDPSDMDIENMQDVEAEIISCHDYQSELILTKLPITEPLTNKVGNWGWVFLSCED